jgi:aryl-alcohol dehydrogenase-like predicted oxidoreductase
MEKRELGRSGIEVTPVGMGVLTVGWSQLDLPLKEGAEVMEYALEKGINFFDTAEYYQTYPYIKEALKHWKGEKPVIASKSLNWSAEEMEKAISD